MLMRRKLCVVLLFAVIVFLMIASHTIQRPSFLPLSMSLSLATPTRGAAANRESEQTVPDLAPAVGAVKPTPGSVTLPPSAARPQGKGPPAGGEAAGETQAASEAQAEPRSEARVCGCADSCIADLQGSDWFKQRYDPEQRPVLFDKDNNMDPDALKWWLGLQRSGQDQTLEEVMSKMFGVIAPPSGEFRPRPSSCRSCAVVGNSGNLRQSKHGKLIDSHAAVIRMNKAVTRGFEEDVGNRTTHHFLYPESAVDMERGVSLVLLPFKLRDLQWLTSALSTGEIKMTYMRVKERVEADKDKVLVVNPAFFKYAHDHWTEHHGRYPSTGMLAIIFSLHICDQVSVFGYGADKEGNWHHYWEENRYAGAFRKTGVHSADFETEVIHRLAKEGKIQLHSGQTDGQLRP